MGLGNTGLANGVLPTLHESRDLQQKKKHAETPKKRHTG